MDQLFQFMANHPIQVGVFVALVALFVWNEMRRGGQTVTAQQLVNLVNRDQAVVIDVRDPNEFAAGHIVGAVNVPHGQLAGRINELARYKERPVVLVCRMGQHSGAAGAVLKGAGFSNVVRLSGGMTEWLNQNLPVVKGRK